MEFDPFAQNYVGAVEAAAGVPVEKLAGEKGRLVRRVLSQTLGSSANLRVLDLGCGIGLIDRELEHGVGELVGADVSLRSLQLAGARAPKTRFLQYDGTRLPFVGETFDAVFASCVLHHVPPPARPDFLAEMLRVLRRGGIALVIEHNPRNPVTRHVVSRCAFDADAVLLTCRETVGLLDSGGATVAGRRYIGFLPFRHAAVEHAERALGWLPAGAQYCVWGRKRGGASRRARTPSHDMAKNISPAPFD